MVVEEHGQTPGMVSGYAKLRQLQPVEVQYAGLQLAEASLQEEFEVSVQVAE